MTKLYVAGRHGFIGSCDKLPRNLKLSEVIPINGRSYHVVTDVNVYWDSKAKTVRVTKADCGDGFLGLLLRIANGDILYLTQFWYTKDQKALFPIFHDYVAHVVRDMDTNAALWDAVDTILNDEVVATNARLLKEAQANHEAALAEREADRLVAAEALRIAASKHELYLDEMQEKFLNGDMIAAHVFEDLCKRHEVDMHMRTKGTLRKSILRLGVQNIQYQYGKNKPSLDGLWQAVNVLKVTLEEKGV